jgi:hypothetical protein
VTLKLVEFDDGGVGVGSESGEVVSDVEDLLEPPLELQHERAQEHLGCTQRFSSVIYLFIHYFVH